VPAINVITFRVDTKLAQRIAAAAKADDRRRSAFLRRLVDRALTDYHLGVDCEHAGAER
jgi:hypothetical protein